MIKANISYPLLLFMAIILAISETNLALIIFAAVLSHELGHIIAIYYLKGRIEHISFGIAGAKITYETSRQLSYGADAMIALAGPAANVLCALLGALLAGVKANDDIYCYIGVSLLLATFNLLPALPLDGGRIVLSVLSRRLGFKTAENICYVLTLILGVAISAIGGYFAIVLKSNATLFIIGIYIISGLYDKTALHKAKKKVLLEH